MHAFVFVIHKLLAMLFRLANNFLADFSVVLIAISNVIASSCFMYYRVSRDSSSIPAKLCNAKFASTIRSCMDEPGSLGMASLLCTSSVTSRIYYFLKKLSPKIMHMLCRTKHVETKSGTFFKCTSTLYAKHKYSKVETSIRMRPLNSLALNEPNRFWSKNFGLCNPRSWAHKRRCCLPLDNLNHALQVSNLILADATVKPPPYLWYTLQCWEQRKLKNNKIARLWTSGSISTRTLVGRLAVGFRVEEN